MKALILSGGHGTPFKTAYVFTAEAADSSCKQAVLFYAIEDVIEAGIRDIGIIEGSEQRTSD